MRMLLAWLHVAINCMKHACYMHGICLLHAWYCACCTHVHSLVLHTCYMHVSNCSSHKSPNIIMHGTCMYICKNTLYAAIMTQLQCPFSLHCFLGSVICLQHLCVMERREKCHRVILRSYKLYSTRLMNMHTLTKDCWASQQKKPQRSGKRAGLYKIFLSSHSVSTALARFRRRHLSGIASEWLDFEKLKNNFEGKKGSCLFQRAPQNVSRDRYIRIGDWLKARVRPRAR